MRDKPSHSNTICFVLLDTLFSFPDKMSDSMQKRNTATSSGIMSKCCIPA